MIHFPKALAAWQTPAFKTVMKAEIEALDADHLPLQQGLTQSSHARPETLSAMILGEDETAAFLSVRAGLFYRGIIAGCSCADDPTPVDEINEYCEVLIEIDRQTAAATISLS